MAIGGQRFRMVMAARSFVATVARMLGEMTGICTVDDQPTTVELDAVVPAEFRGDRFDRAAAKLLAMQTGQPAVSRSELARWIRTGLVTLDGRVAKPKAAVAGGERMQARVARAPRFDWSAAEKLDLCIVYEDDSVLVVDKPPGLVVHPGAGNARGTLINGLLHHRSSLAALPRAGLIHRLDKDTSGLLAIAADEASLLALREAMSARRIERRYLAVTEGRLIADRRIDLAIGRDPRNRLRQTVRTDGRPAVTYVSVRRRYAVHTLVEALLETGRTHQLRVHLAAVGHPLVGDRRYGSRGIVPPEASEAAAATVRGFPRQALHAARLAFAHPATGERMTFKAALPGDMQRLLQALEGTQVPYRSATDP